MIGDYCAAPARGRDVFVYPTWWSGLPAVLKGWLERVMVPGVGFTLDEQTRKVSPAWQHPAIAGIGTYGSPWSYVKLMNDNGRRIIRVRCDCRADGARTTWLALYAIDTADVDQRQRHLERIETRLAALWRACSSSTATPTHSRSRRPCATALDALATHGHDVRLTDLYADGFEPAMSCDERRTHKEPGAPELQRYADDLRWAQALVLVYPTWWSGQPAMLKGWIDRVWVAGVAWNSCLELTSRGPCCATSAVSSRITGHGSSKLVNALEGESGKRTMTRSMRAMRRTRTTWCAVYGLDTADEDARERFLDKVERGVMPRL